MCHVRRSADLRTDQAPGVSEPAITDSAPSRSMHRLLYDRRLNHEIEVIEGVSGDRLYEPVDVFFSAIRESLASKRSRATGFFLFLYTKPPRRGTEVAVTGGDSKSSLSRE